MATRERAMKVEPPIARIDTDWGANGALLVKRQGNGGQVETPKAETPKAEMGAGGGEAWGLRLEGDEGARPLTSARADAKGRRGRELMSRW